MKYAERYNCPFCHNSILLHRQSFYQSSLDFIFNQMVIIGIPLYDLDARNVDILQMM